MDKRKHVEFSMLTINLIEILPIEEKEVGYIFEKKNFPKIRIVFEQGKARMGLLVLL